MMMPQSFFKVRAVDFLKLGNSYTYIGRLNFATFVEFDWTNGF